MDGKRKSTGGSAIKKKPPVNASQTTNARVGSASGHSSRAIKKRAGTNSRKRKARPLSEVNEKNFKRYLSILNWFLGDLLWVRIKGHPYWPCMITNDPTEEIYKKNRKFGRHVVKKYHVTFFCDDGSRAWVTKGQMIKFEGGDECLSILNTLTKIEKHFEVSDRDKGPWDKAIDEAEKLLHFEREDRLKRFAEMRRKGEI